MGPLILMAMAVLGEVARMPPDPPAHVPNRAPLFQIREIQDVPEPCPVLGRAAPNCLTAREGGVIIVQSREAKIGKVIVSGYNLDCSSVVEDDVGRPAIELSFDRKGAAALEAYTRQHLGGHFAIVVDGAVISKPRIMATISDGVGRIEGGDEKNDFQALSKRINTQARGGRGC